MTQSDFVEMTESDFLEHFGIPGMKWGHRKNSSRANEEHSFAKASSKKSISSMSNQELARASQRMMLENQYKTTSTQYKTLNRNAANNFTRKVGGMLLTGTTAAVVGIYAGRGAKYISGNLDKYAGLGLGLIKSRMRG